MTSKPLKSLPDITPAFRIPLDENYLAQIGVLSVVWSQIDFFLIQAISRILSIDPDKIEFFLETTTTGGRVNTLRKLVPAIHDDKVKKKTKDFLEKIGPLIDKRNHVMHGMWGYFIPKGKKQTRPAAHFRRRSDKPMFPNDMLQIIIDAFEASHLIFQIQHSLMGSDYTPSDEIPAFFFGAGPPPDWL